jgi:hypothetical protein
MSRSAVPWLLAVLAPLGACSTSAPPAQPSPSSAPNVTDPAAPAPGTVTRTGTLRSGMMAIGGETTGWVLVIDGREPLEVDVSGVFTDAQRLANRRVTMTGVMTRKRYVERGETPVLKATRVEAAK